MSWDDDTTDIDVTDAGDIETRLYIEDLGLFRHGSFSQYDRAAEVCAQFTACMDRALVHNDCIMPRLCAEQAEVLMCEHLTVDFSPTGNIPMPANRAAILEQRMRILGAQVALLIGDGTQEQLEAVEANEEREVAAYDALIGVDRRKSSEPAQALPTTHQQSRSAAAPVPPSRPRGLFGKLFGSR